MIGTDGDIRDQCRVCAEYFRDDLTKGGMASLAHFRESAVEENTSVAGDLDSGLSRFVDAPTVLDTNGNAHASVTGAAPALETDGIGHQI